MNNIQRRAQEWWWIRGFIRVPRRLFKGMLRRINRLEDENTELFFNEQDRLFRRKSLQWWCRPVTLRLVNAVGYTGRVS